jgi:hypothetical protein
MSSKKGRFIKYNKKTGEYMPTIITRLIHGKYCSRVPLPKPSNNYDDIKRQVDEIIQAARKQIEMRRQGDGGYYK